MKNIPLCRNLFVMIYSEIRGRDAQSMEKIWEAKDSTYKVSFFLLEFLKSACVSVKMAVSQSVKYFC